MSATTRALKWDRLKRDVRRYLKHSKLPENQGFAFDRSQYAYAAVIARMDELDKQRTPRRKPR
jgi:hypothetical protein